MNQSFGKAKRVLRGSQFTQALRTGNCSADGTLVVFAVERSKSLPSRVGITVPKKTGNAVVRNRWKRLIRESFRTQQNQIPRGFDFIVRPKKGASPRWNDIRRSLPRMAARAAGGRRRR